MADTGLVHVYTGKGKGKTSAAVGLAVRARGAGLNVLFAQLFKTASSEDEMLKKIGIKHIKYTSQHPLFKKYSDEETESEARKCELFVREAFELAKKEGYHVLIIDELGPALSYNLLKTEIIVKLIKDKPAKLELVMTGRAIPIEVIKLADYVTRTMSLAHPYEKGLSARKGIDF